MVTVNTRKRVRGPSRRTRKGSYDNKAKMLVLFLAIAAVLFFLWWRYLLTGGGGTTSQTASDNSNNSILPPRRSTGSTAIPAMVSQQQQQQHHLHHHYNADGTATNGANSCGLYLAPSQQVPGSFGLFLGTHKAPREHVAEPDIVIPIFDANKNEWSPWHNYALPAEVVQGLRFESKFRSDILTPGIMSMAVGALNAMVCSNELANMKMEHGVRGDAAGVHRSKSPSAGSFSYFYNFAFVATHQLEIGEELFMPCEMQQDTSPYGQERKRKSMPPELLATEGVCIDTLAIGASTLADVGRGAFSKQTVAAGRVIAVSPVIHLDRSDAEIVEQAIEPDDLIPVQRKHGIRYTDTVVGQQLLLNYCYSSPESNILLLPYAPGVNFINHSREKANAVIRWTPNGLQHNTMMKEHPSILLGVPAMIALTIEFVALRDIQPGEEIFIDYGDAWIAAWKQHVAAWPRQDASYVSGHEFKRLYGRDNVRTEAEQATRPYPKNLQTACFFTAASLLPEKEPILWENTSYDCLRPCDIKERPVDNVSGVTTYTAHVYAMETAEEPAGCGHVPEGGVLVTRIPEAAVGVMDRPYSTDTHLKDAFRHAIGTPVGMYPSAWNATDPNPTGDFETPPLKPGELAHVHWKDSGEIVTPQVYRLGLSHRVRSKILEYCNKIGITETLRRATAGGNSLEQEQNVFMNLNKGEHKWYLQRPGKQWRANMHWISPGDELATQDWLEMLSEAGFDEMLKGIGKALNMTGLVAFHGTFMGASVSTKHYLHFDVLNSTAKHFNIIIPLQSAEHTGPELDIKDANVTGGQVKSGRYRYEKDVAIMLGDKAYHGTSPVDYRVNKEFRLAATVFVADVNEENVDAILEQYTQIYPPPDRNLLLSWAGSHWKKDDPSASLPRPKAGHILLRDEDSPGTKATS